MTSNLKYSKNYTELGETYQLVLPLSLEGLVPDDDSVRLLSHELEELDYTLLYKAYSSKGIIIVIFLANVFLSNKLLS